MKISYINIIKYLAALAFALLLLYLAFRNVDFDGFWAKTKEVDYSYIYISLALGLFSYALRAYRWNLLLETMGYRKLTTPRTMVSVLVGYLANMALPRMGEVTRCAALQRTEKVKFSEGLGSVIVERIVDSITLIVVIIITLLLEFDKLAGFFRAYIFPNYNFSNQQILLMGIAAVGLAIGGIIVIKLIGKTSNSAGKHIIFLKETLEGLKSIKNIKNISGFVLSSIGIWVSYYFMSYIIVFSLPETSQLGWLAGLSLLVTGGIGMAMPVQGGIGTFHLFVSAMLVSYGIDQQTGIFLATLLHTSQLFAILVFGTLAVIASFLIKPASTEKLEK